MSPCSVGSLHLHHLQLVAAFAAGALLVWSVSPRAALPPSHSLPVAARSTREWLQYSPGDPPDVLLSTQALFEASDEDLEDDELGFGDANPLYTPANKGFIAPIFAGDPPHDGLWSKMANEGDLNTSWAARNAELLHIWTGKLHRKTWELVYILELVNREKKCARGSRGLVFAAGLEPLASRFAQQGCFIHASDYPRDPAGGENNAWVQTNQHASLGMYKDWLDRKEFDRLVSYEELDMNFLELGTGIQRESFDFLWSTCSVEHLGSVSLGKRFIMNAMALLKPGGLAVHTVEFTLSSTQYSRVRHGSTALWTRADVVGLARDLCFLGYEVMPLRFEAGTGYGDMNPDSPPYEDSSMHPHIKLWLYDQICTAFAIVVRKPLDHQRGRQHICHRQYEHQHL